MLSIEGQAFSKSRQVYEIADELRKLDFHPDEHKVIEKFRDKLGKLLDHLQKKFSAEVAIARRIDRLNEWH